MATRSSPPMLNEKRRPCHLIFHLSGTSTAETTTRPWTGDTLRRLIFEDVCYFHPKHARSSKTLYASGNPKRAPKNYNMIEQ